MRRTCARAVEIGLPAVAFTEHADYTPWIVLTDDLDEHSHLKTFATPDGTLTPRALDLDGYLESLQRCREEFPGLRVISGVELGEPHWHERAVTSLLNAGQFDRVLRSLHCLPVGHRFSEMSYLYQQNHAAQVMREYLAEVARLVEGCHTFAVLGHIDYAARYWPARAGRFEPEAFEDEFRHALHVLARSDRALEVNTRGPLHPEVIAWWGDEGGEAVTFGSDAHDPTLVGRGFHKAVSLVEAQGYRPGRHPHDFWTRTS